jgi:hypothetical protein
MLSRCAIDCSRVTAEEQNHRLWGSNQSEANEAQVAKSSQELIYLW